ncbi:MAG: hypothetical protein QXY90_05815 [Candidatus Anstonellales archaeon]
MDLWVKEIVEQIALGISLKESTLDSSNRLALIVVDNAVEFGVKFYAKTNSLLPKKELSSNDALYKVLGILESNNKISADLSRRIKQFHDTRNNLYHGADITTVLDKVINEYVKDAKELFKILFNIQMKESDWQRSVNDVRKELTKVNVSLKEPVSFEAVEIEGKHLVRVITPADPKNTEQIMLAIFGYQVTRARTPLDEELKQSLMLSGFSIPENVLAARLSELRSNGSIERREFRLKGKGESKLRKKFLL